MSKRPDPFWTIRGVYNGQDICLVVEGASQTAAECFATKRGVEVVFVEEADPMEVSDARSRGLLWRYTPEAKLRCFGRPVTMLQAACLMLCGLATILMNLRAQHVELPIKLF